MAEKQSNFLVQLFKGDVPLVITFWVFNVLAGTIIWYFIPILLVHIASQLYLSIAVWNSAGKYEGLALWKIIAKILAALGILSAIVIGAVYILGVVGIVDIPQE